MATKQSKRPYRSYPKRGFASMDRETQRAIASKGGKAAHALGVAHQWTAEEASIAGYKGATVGWLKRRKLAAAESSFEGVE